MTAIGGIFNRFGEHCDTEALARMSKAMRRRSTDLRSALILDGCGFIWGSDARHGVLAESENVLLLCDGEVSIAPTGEGARYFGESEAGLCLSVYEKYGLSAREYLWGEYSYAAYNRAGGELVLARDRDRSRPLYYAQSATAVGFASEIKGILAFLGEARVSRDMLCAHIFSRYGEIRSSDIYTQINDVGESVVISKNGVTDMRGLEACDDTEGHQVDREYIGGALVCPDEEGMGKMLSEILYAFDIPQFDCLMPSFLRDAKKAKDSLCGVVDGALCFDLSYAAERRDRLSVIVGYRPNCIPTGRYNVGECDLKKMEKLLRTLFFQVDRAKLEYIFGMDIEAEIMKIENTARRVRALGMAIQTEKWYDGYRIILE